MEFTTHPLSTITARTFRRLSSIPQARPVGPAPTTTTSTVSTGVTASARPLARCSRAPPPAAMHPYRHLPPCPDARLLSRLSPAPARRPVSRPAPYPSHPSSRPRQSRRLHPLP